ncbi:hypothetical protein BS636_08740 [Acinetobacter sp. LoGeW2-3]|uniref:hypothetical protein n=1 Tax=Acinetobacter sp. LoGeW2-3 TaxID=1808001 RepID=UPI000C05BDF8|nr:hypothetical protein [Acinetobacter sp. LoGeW2-3]ATO21040.1 hypothetical protein BS636_08740 [Acinetobacter sp. LoGeW2-3]
MNKIIYGLFLCSTILTTSSYAMTELVDQDLSEVTGQALFNMIKETDSTQGLDFFKLAINGELSLNTNIKNLQLGCGGINGADGCDIDISEFSLGCVVGGSGSCITLPTNVTGQPKGTDYDNTIANQKDLRDFVLTNPFFQFAIKGGNQASTRQVVGVRVGAENAKGPMSIGTMNSFSGYLTGVNNLYIQAQENVAVTCKAGTTGCSEENASKYSQDFMGDYGLLGGGKKQQYAASAYLGVANAEILNLLNAVTVEYRDQTINTQASKRENLSILANGKRMQQVQIHGLQLGSLVDEVVQNLTINQMCTGHDPGECSFIGTQDIGNLLLPLLRTGIKTYMKEETLKGLNLGVPNKGSQTNDAYSNQLTTILNNYVLPFNLGNVHQIDVDSNLFGIALTSLAEGIKYPGFAEQAKATQGWSMYLEDAFTININQPLTTLMSNIVQTGLAAQGNITMLEPAYRNCFGGHKFC